jgi:hypothetical protein
MAGSAAASAKSGSSDIVRTRKRSARGRAPAPTTILKIALLAAGAIFIGWLCVRAAAVEVLARRSPLAAAKLAPDDPRVAIGLANVEFRVSQGALTAATAQRGMEALRSAPLESDPFFFAGLRKLIENDNAASFRLVEEARRRNPRSRMARLVYLDQALRAGRTDEAATEIAAVSRLVPETSRILVPELARYAADPRTSPALIKALKPDPGLRDRVLVHLASNRADPDLILRLAESGPPPPDLKGTPEWQSRLLVGLVERGDITRARALWARLAGIKGPVPSDTLYDGAFRGAPGPAPFNWQFTQSAAGVAEPTRTPALQVEYYGRANAELASQLLQMRPGRHNLSFTATGNTPASGGSVAWTLSCIGGKQAFATIPVARISYAPKRFAAGFAVPASCPAQWLRLIGTPAEFPAAHSFTLSDVRIRDGDAS